MSQHSYQNRRPTPQNPAERQVRAQTLTRPPEPMPRVVQKPKLRTAQPSVKMHTGAIPNNPSKRRRPIEPVYEPSLRRGSQMQDAALPKRPKDSLRFFFGPMDYSFLILVLVILSVGLLMLFSASYPRAFAETGNSFFYISRQLLFSGLGIVGMYVVSLIPFQIYQRFAVLFYLFAVGLLVLVLVIPTRDDAKRWINLGFTTFQPSEVAKLAIIILFAHLISKNYERMKNPRYGILPFMVALGLVAVLMLMEPHLSGTILIMAIGISMMFIGGTDLKWFILAGIVVLAAVTMVAIMPSIVPYAMDRLQFWRDPWKAPLKEGYQTIQSLYAIGSGGLFGVGFGNSRQKYLYLPEVQNDFVFSVVCEELGFIGAAIVISLFVFLLWRGYVIAMRCRDRFGSMVAVGIITQVGLQTVLNIAVVSNTIPNTGISLPFFSYGGTSLVMQLLQMGIVLAVSRQSVVEKTS